MSQGDVVSIGSSFANEIASITAPRATEETIRGKFMTVWKQFIEGLRQSKIGAEIRPSDDDGSRYHLMLWPEHRPAWRTHLFTFRITASEILVSRTDTTTCRTPEELAEMLRNFASSEHFQATLRWLREQARDPVEARLVVEGAPDLLIKVSADDQRKIATTSAQDLKITIELDEWDPIPDPKYVRTLRSAGFELTVTNGTLHGRNLELHLRKQS